MAAHPKFIAFAGDACIAAGDLACVAVAARKAAGRANHDPIFIFDAVTSAPVDLDLRGTREDVLARLPSPPVAAPEPEAPRGPGRPRLGVVAREVTLLPRHWDWLASQPGGASVALRKLVEHASRANTGKDRVRAAQNAAYRFMSAMAGNRVGFEDAARALFAGEATTFGRLVTAWPSDICDHLKTLAADALQAKDNAATKGAA
jgi:hypothetical protein